MENSNSFLTVDEAMSLWNIIKRMPEPLTSTYDSEANVPQKFMQYIFLAAGLSHKLMEFIKITETVSCEALGNVNYSGCAYMDLFSEMTGYTYENFGLCTDSLIGAEYLCMKMRADSSDVRSAAMETIELYEERHDALRTEYESNLTSVLEYLEYDTEWVEDWCSRFDGEEKSIYAFCKAVIRLLDEGVAVIHEDKKLGEFYKLCSGLVNFKDKESGKDFFRNNVGELMCIFLSGPSLEFSAINERVDTYASDALASLSVSIANGCAKLWTEVVLKKESDRSEIENVFVDSAKSIVETPFFSCDIIEIEDIFVDGDDLMFISTYPETSEYGYEIEAGNSIKTILAPLVFDAIKCELMRSGQLQ